MYPTGTVTFLFTDIEGSTPLWEQMPREMQAAVALHHRLLTQAIEENGGQVFQILGDAFQAAFRLAPEALRAAIQAQRALQEAEWGPTGPLRVRIGLHTGAAEVEERDGPGKGEYKVSHTLNRSARVMSAGHGGQILLSQEAADLVSREIPPGVSLRDLGLHHLKGMQQPEHLYQVVASGLPKEFPPLPTALNLPNNLPPPITKFIGRETESHEVMALLNEYRLVTLTGPGGTGKTRLAIEVARKVLNDYPEGTWLVELATASDARLVPDLVASVFRLPEAPGQTREQQLAEYLKTKELLLVLDNCEHLVEACARWCEETLRFTENVRILATSREAVNIPGEAIFRVPSLRLPENENPEKMFYSEAVQLFLSRAEAGNPDFCLNENTAASIFQICTRLDGIPLALELAASRVRTIGVDQIAARLDDRFRLLSGGNRTALPRQQTLRAAIDWSDSLLSEPEKRLFYRLAIFSGGWTLEAAEAVCSGDPDESATGAEEESTMDLLASLVNKSLVVLDQLEAGDTRYTMLETIRQYALEKLRGAGELNPYNDRHLEYYARWTEQTQEKIRWTANNKWLQRYNQEMDNIRAALEWGNQNDKPACVESGLRIIWGTWLYWLHQGHMVEGLRLAERVLAAAERIGVSGLHYGRALCATAPLAIFQGYYQKGEEYARRAIEICQAANDWQAVGISLHHIGVVQQMRDIDFAQAEQSFQEGLRIARRIQDRWLESFFLTDLGGIAHERGDIAEARRIFTEDLALNRAQGNSLNLLYVLLNVSQTAILQNSLEEAENYIEEGFEVNREVDHPRAEGLLFLQKAQILRRKSQFMNALNQWEESLRVFWEIRDRENVIEALEGLALTQTELEDFAEAAYLYGVSQAAREQYQFNAGTIITEDEKALITKTREQLGEDEFTAHFNQGRQTSMDESVERILNKSFI